MKNEKYQKNLIKLFENGAIRISQFGDIRSLSQYLINSVSADKEFIYSALPVKYSQKHILALIKRKVYVYLIEVDAYRFDASIHEGIEEIVEVPSDEMEGWIRDGKITDGFTLGAYALLTSFKG